MSLDKLQTSLISQDSSLKVVDTLIDAIRLPLASPSSDTYTYPHGLGTDDIIIGGRVIQHYTVGFTTDEYGIPYVDATGGNLFTVSWDDTNIYTTANNYSTGAGFVDYLYILVIMIA